MPEVAVVGAGVGGLHLSLLLQQRQVPVTLYAERPPDEMRQSPRLMNTAGHWVPTRERERELGVSYWDDEFPRVATLNVTVGGEMPLQYSRPQRVLQISAARGVNLGAGTSRSSGGS
jgi:2-polyprenyl-6-methoxyphenol hydroxylase-like FAD-dependent oxidoreductase